MNQANKQPDVVLPKWAKFMPVAKGKTPKIEVDAELMYQSFLSEYGVETIDRYWLEVCYQSMKMDLQLAMKTFQFQIHVSDTDKKFALAKAPDIASNDPRIPHSMKSRKPPKGMGLGEFVATKGKKAREHFKKLRGSIPGAG